MKKIIAVVALLAIALTMLISCGNKVEKGYSKDYAGAGLNSDKSLRVAGGWTKTGVGTHFASGPDMGPIGMYCLEGCMQYVRNTEHFTYLIAEKFVHADDDPDDDVNDGESVIVIRDGAKWHDGGKVVAMDIMGYYALCTTTLTSYVSDMYVIDDNANGDLSDDMRVKIVWKSWKEPTDYSKNVLLAQDTKNCSVQYSKFKAYVDASLDLIYNGENGVPNDKVTQQSEGIGEERLGRHASAIAGSLGSIYNNFRATVLTPDGSYDGYYYCGTGPFKVKSVTENQMVLVKNADYYFADKVGFDSIVATQYSNSNMIFSDLINGKLDFVDGCYDKSLTESILSSNGSIVSYKNYDQGGIGIYYNLEKPVWENDKVRLAFQYMFDRDSIKNLVNPYATTSYKPLMVMSPVEARQYLDPEVYASIAEYEYDVAKAEQLLSEGGWTKQGGKWYDEKGQAVSLTLGYQNSQPFANIALAVKAQLDKIGIDCVVKSGNDMTTWFSTASAQNSIYDFVAAATELNTYGTHPGGSMKHFFEMIQCGVMHLETGADGKFSIEVDLLDANDPSVSLGKVRVIDLYNRIYCTEGAELKQYANSVVLGMSKYNYGVQIYENVSGCYFNLDRIGGLPSVERFTVDRNITFVPDATDDEYAQYVIINSGFSQAVAIVEGIIYAR